jgi:hypothetical protein
MRARHTDAAAYGLGVLDDPAEFEAHLRGCARCRGLVDGFRPVTEALGQADRLGYLSPEDGGRPAPAGVGYPPPGATRSGHPLPGRPVRPGGDSPARADHPAPGGESAYPPPAGESVRDRKPGGFGRRRGAAAGPLLLLALGVAVTAPRAVGPAAGKIRFASAASIVSPAQVVAGTGRELRDLPWPTGFQ